jgi:dTDP-4-amino-4,6-dideoxygalactose transaminase
MNIPFNVPYLTGNEMIYIQEAVALGKLSGNGHFTQKCQKFFEERYGFGKCLLTTSCTDALEMAAILANIGPGDEVIVPSFTFVSTALAFVRQGATIVFADSEPMTPNIDVARIEELVTARTKAIVPVHYAGIACDMDAIMDIASRHNLLVIEDAAQAIDSYHVSRDGTKRALGSIGHMAAFSFHETKNIIAGEGGMLAINDKAFFERSEIIWEKGTDRSKFFRGEIDKYGWVDTGSSFLPSEITAAFLWAQVESIDDIQKKRMALWCHYMDSLSIVDPESHYKRAQTPPYAIGNAHLFYITCPSEFERGQLIHTLRSQGIHAVFHYLSLHQSSYYKQTASPPFLQHADHYSARLLRLPLYNSMSFEQIDFVVKVISSCLATD